MNDETIIQLADKLAVPVERVFEIVVEAQSTLAMIYTLCALIVLTGTVVGYILTKKYVNESNCPAVIGGMIGALIGAVVCIFVYAILVAIYLPEYAAIMKLAELI